MEVKNRKLSSITAYGKNAKKHDKTKINNVAESIKQYGFVQPIVVDRGGVIVIGHCRALAAKKLGMEEVPCVCVDDLTPEQVNALRLVDNKSNESDWDFDLLAVELPGLDLSAFDFDWGLCDELNGSVVEDDYDPVLPAEPKSKLGDVYKLGDHRLMCGDSTSLTDVQRLVGEAQIDLLITDPPYNVALGMDETPEEAKKRNRRTDGKTVANDKMEDTEFRQFLTDAFSNAAMVMKPGAPFYIWHADSEGYNFRGACKDAMLRVRQCLIWVKNSLVMGRQDFQWKHEPCLYGESEIEEDEHEPCLYGWTEGHKHYFFKNRRQTTVLNFDKPVKSAEHPTMKPIKLFDYQMQCSSKPGENVLDLFAGSGTTIMAAEQNGRHAYCMEFDPKYADVIIDRWEKFTGEKAVLLSDD
jgi:site-specific DNA-methyltransferase (adenine-specific)